MPRRPDNCEHAKNPALWKRVAPGKQRCEKCGVVRAALEVHNGRIGQDSRL